MSTGFSQHGRIKSLDVRTISVQPPKTKAIVVNLSSSGSRLGGAATAAEWHSRFMASQFPLELWRMWDTDNTFFLDELKVKNYSSFVPNSILRHTLPKRAKAAFLESNILQDLLKSDADIVHLQNPLPALYFQKMVTELRKAGKIVVSSTHGFFEVFNPNYELGKTQKLAWRELVTKPIEKSLPLLNFILAGYPEEKEFLIQKKISSKAIEIIPNGINPYFIEPPSDQEIKAVLTKFTLNLDRPILLFVGNHTKNKGLDTVIKVACQIKHPSTFIIAGKLLHPNEEMEWKNKYDIPEHIEVVFTDYLSLEEQRSLYHLSQVLLFPSLADTLPLTILEAMACGLPVIAYAVGGIPYQLENGCGLLIPVDDFEQYLTATNTLLRSNKQRSEIAEKAKIRQQTFTWEEAARKTIQVYERLIKEKNIT